MRRMLGKEVERVLLRAIKDHLDIVIASSPRIFEQGRRFLLIQRREFVAQPIQRSAQRSTPFLRPARVSARVAATIGAPTFNAVNAAPRAVGYNLRKVVGRMPLKEFAIVRKLGEFIGFNVVQRVRERPLPKAVVGAVAFAIRRDMYQLRPRPRVRKAAHQPVGKALTIVEQTLEGHALRNRSIVEKNGDSSFRWQLNQVSAAGIHAIAADVLPGTAAALAGGLGGGQGW